MVRQGGPAGPLARVLIGRGLVEVAGRRQRKNQFVVGKLWELAECFCPKNSEDNEERENSNRSPTFFLFLFFFLGPPNKTTIKGNRTDIDFRLWWSAFIILFLRRVNKKKEPTGQK